MAARLGPVLHALAERGVYFGGSSWKYEGWLGSIYTPERYVTRRKFSRKKFEAECLSEYVETFPSVGGDFSFYQFPTADYWSRLFSATPPTFTFGLKVPEHITVPRWPGHARYGARAGETNEFFLDAGFFERQFIAPLTPHREQVGVLMFEFGAFSKSDFPNAAAFLERLTTFLDALPSGWRYGVEIRNKDFLGSEYCAALAQRNVAHIFNAWTRMPTLSDQIALPEAFTADFAVVRALLQKGRAYEDAVSLFEPYRGVQESDLETRDAMRQVADRGLRLRQRVYIFVNNRLEGYSPGTIEAILAGAKSGPLAEVAAPLLRPL
jgi:uncharacterized protein YecE (DUF72 family)